MASPARAERLRSIALVQGTSCAGTGTETLVASGLPQAIAGCVVSARNAVVLCANNLKGDPQRVWETLAHESAHVMQHCRRQPIFERGKSAWAWIFCSPITAHRSCLTRLASTTPSQHLTEIEARIVQRLPAKEVMNLFRRSCADRLF